MTEALERMTPEEIHIVAQDIQRTTWVIAVDAFIASGDQHVAHWIGFAWAKLIIIRDENAWGVKGGVLINQARSALDRTGWHPDPWKLSEWEIATVILTKIYGGTDDGVAAES